MLQLTDADNQSSTIMVATPINDLTKATDVVTVTSVDASTPPDIAVNTFAMYTGSASGVKLPLATGLAEDDAVRVHNAKHFDITVYKNDGTSKVDTIPPGSERSYQVSGGAWVQF